MAHNPCQKWYSMHFCLVHVVVGLLYEALVYFTRRLVHFTRSVSLHHEDVGGFY